MKMNVNTLSLFLHKTFSVICLQFLPPHTRNRKDCAEHQTKTILIGKCEQRNMQSQVTSKKERVTKGK